MKVIVEGIKIDDYGSYYSSSENVDLIIQPHSDEKILLKINEMHIIINREELEKAIKILCD